jgi:hypothetical protein
MSWLAAWRRSKVLSAKAQRDLETWVRLPLRLAASDPMVAIIGAVARLIDAGMGVDDATDTVLRLVRETEAGGAWGVSERRASAPDA